MAGAESGMTKVGTGAKLEDSNIANYGSKEHKDAKLAAAQTEPAWEGAGKKVGIEVWRIEKFKVVRQEKKTYGSFFRGDSYIVLNTYKPDVNSEKFAYNVHFWLGKETTQDEAGTAAYKTVELDDLLGDVPVQYREVDGYESEEFMSCFKGNITILDGGIDSGFNHVEPDKYAPRLFHLKGKKNISVAQVPLSVDSLNVGDSFLLDMGMELIQWNAPKSGMFEKRKGGEVTENLMQERNGRPTKRILDGCEDDPTFWKTLKADKPPAMSALKPETDDHIKFSEKKVLMEVSDKTGKLECKKVEWARTHLRTDECYLVDLGIVIYSWIGKGASKAERSHGIKFASDYLVENKLPFSTPIVRIMEGHEPLQFKKAF
eukprot:gb/GEZN01006508.1/.p1 GENE.gb/GEZN01006508.1/~~gb/GEZN01006508.1/.p1  ORF type:complete len:437 (+),score=88.29 gb/GEZN01006508.1/:192-1313(+)